MPIPISLKTAVDASHHYEVPNIKFTFVVQEGTFNVSLHNMRPKSAILVSFSFLEQVLNFIEAQAHLNAHSPVAILPWLYYPGIVLLQPIFSLCGPFGNLFIAFVIVPKKLKVLLIFDTVLDVESKR